MVECGLWWSVVPSGVWFVVECGLGWGVACGSFWFFSVNNGEYGVH